GAPSWPTYESLLPVARNATDNLYFSSIQAAVDAATTSTGEIIEVFDGTHAPFSVNKPGLTIKPASGANPVIETAQPASPIIRIINLQANDTVLEGFTVRSATSGSHVGIAMPGKNLTVRN